MAEAAKGAFFGLLGKKKVEDAPVDPKAPIPIHTPSAPDYDQQAVGNLFVTRIKFRGLYDLDGLYRFIANWLRQRRYEVHETLYKAKPPELEIRLRAERKKTGFVMDVLTV